MGKCHSPKLEVVMAPIVTPPIGKWTEHKNKNNQGKDADEVILTSLKSELHNSSHKDGRRIINTTKNMKVTKYMILNDYNTSINIKQMRKIA